MQERQETAGQALLSAQQVQDLLHVDRSTVYRMAEDGRLPAIKVGRQWRFPAARINALLSGTDEQADPPRTADGLPPEARGNAHVAQGAPLPDPAVARAVVQVAADLLGVMMVLTDMQGRPLIEVSNPCPWFADRLDDPALLTACIQEWRQLADDVVLEPRFHTGPFGFQCARAFVRSGTSLVAMVLAGGIAPDPPDGDSADMPDGLYRLGAKQRRRVLDALPGVAASLSHADPRQAAGVHARSTPNDTAAASDVDARATSSERKAL